MMRRLATLLPLLLLATCAPQPAPAPAPDPARQPAPEATPAAPAPGAEQERREAAQGAAEAWLGHVDTGAYGQSWTEAAQIFRQAVTTAQWEQALGEARAPLGALQSRTLRDAQYHTELPNVPAGEYMVLVYESRFAEVDRPLAEQVVLAREPEGRWRVAGYFVR